MINYVTELITADCIIDQEIYLTFSKFHRFYVKKSSKNMIIFPGMLLGFAMLNWFLGKNLIGLILFAISILLPAGSIMTFYYHINKQVKLYQLKKPRIFYTLIFSDKGIHIKNQNEHVDYDWSQIYKIYQTKCGFYLYITPVKAFIIPFGSLKNNTMDDLWSLFRKKILDKKLINRYKQ